MTHQARDQILRLAAGDSVPVDNDLDALKTVLIVVIQGYVDTRRVRVNRVPNQLGDRHIGFRVCAMRERLGGSVIVGGVFLRTGFRGFDKVIGHRKGYDKGRILVVY